LDDEGYYSEDGIDDDYFKKYKVTIENIEETYNNNNYDNIFSNYYSNINISNIKIIDKKYKNIYPIKLYYGKISIFNFGTFKKCINECIYPAHMYGLCQKCLYVERYQNKMKWPDYDDHELFNMDIDIFKENIINTIEKDRIQKIEEFINMERIDDDIRNKNAYNICRIFGCMFITRYNFCNNHICYEKIKNNI
jgi:hypothetical protein